MKILNLTLKNHPVLGNQNIDFISPDNRVCKMVIFAGENGVGKSTTMDIIHDFCNLKIPKLAQNESREITLKLDLSEINSIRYPSTPVPSLENLNCESNIKIGFDYNIGSKHNYFYIITDGKNKSYCKEFLTNKNTLKILSNIYMDHDLNRSGNKNQELTTWVGRRSSENQGFNTELYLIQAYQWRKEIEFENNKLKEVQFYHDLELSELPYNRAIRELIPNLRILGAAKNKKHLLISKDNVKFNFQKLSSGEKQILGMTAFLTYDIDKSDGAPILIDEPENNLHPNLQLKIRDYFRNLFRGDHQIFIVTHSPFIIHSPQKDDERIFIFKKIKKNKINISDLGYFPSADHFKKINESFNIHQLFNQISDSPTIFVEGETDEKYLNDIKNLFFKNIEIEIQWIGHYGDKQGPVFTGTPALDSVFNVLSNKPRITSKKIILLYDCDVPNFKVCNTDKLKKFQLPKYTSNSVFNKGIENSLLINFNVDQFYFTKTINRDYGEKSIVTSFQKVKLCDYILSLNLEEKRKCYSQLISYFNKLIQEI